MMKTKNTMRAMLILLLLLPAFAAQAGNETLQDLLARIDYLQVEDTHRTSYVWSGRFNAINGDTYNVTQFYRSKAPQFNLTMAIRLHQSARWRVALPVQMDNGYRADLYRARPYLGLGLVAQWAKSERLVLGFHLHDALKLGGEVREYACYDGFRRQFHCGTGLPWTDAGPHLRKSNVATFGQFTVNWRF